jgi:2-oxoglutarate/2-oxoacid ferredoxin oxidoreductase subunit beta
MANKHPKKKIFAQSQEELTAHDPTWCTGCGDFSIWIALKQAIVALGLDPEEVVMVYGIGCSGNMANTIKSYGFHGLHGRPVPPAMGIKLTNHKMKVIVIAGDGDTYGEGISHFMHAMRGNHDVTHIVHDNQIYGLTTGQTSPTSDQGTKSKSTPAGSIEEPVNPMALSLTGGASYIARGFSGDNPQLTNLIIEGLKHPGYSFIDVFQPCVTFNKVNTYKWFFDHVYKLENEKYDQTDKVAAWAKAHEPGDKFATGIFYQERIPAYHEKVGAIKKLTLVEQPIRVRDLSKELENYN